MYMYTCVGVCEYVRDMCVCVDVNARCLCVYIEFIKYSLLVILFFLRAYNICIQLYSISIKL